MNASAVSVLVVTATVLFALLAGSGVDRGLVSFPARRRIGIVAWSQYSRAADLGNGRYLYPPLAIGVALAAIASFVLVWAGEGPHRMGLPLLLATISGAGNLVVTVADAPKMLRIGKTDDREDLLKPLVEAFVRLSYLRLAFICLAFAFMLWALVLASC